MYLLVLVTEVADVKVPLFPASMGSARPRRLAAVMLEGREPELWQVLPTTRMRRNRTEAQRQ